LEMFKNFKENKALKRQRNLADDHAERLSDRLAQFQTVIEIQAEALSRKDAEMDAFVAKLHATMGVPVSTEEDTFESLRTQRAHADLYRNIRAVLAGRYDADDALMRRLACAMGCSQWDSGSLVRRASNLAVGNRKLELDLAQARARIEEE